MPTKTSDKTPSTEHFCSHCHHSNFASFARNVACASGRPLSFCIAMSVIAVWAITGPIFHFNDTWQLVINTGTTIVTFLMVFLIQNTQNRDSAAVQLKLDEIIRSMDTAENKVMGFEEMTQEELDEVKNEYLTLAKAAEKKIKKTSINKSGLKEKTKGGTHG
jgi:low affinity Fe/Cu permease